MKKRYGFSNIIGKKSTLRFPRLVYNVHPETITFILHANTVVKDTAINTALTMKRIDADETYDLFNDISSDYEDEFPIRVAVTFDGVDTQTTVLNPSFFSLVQIVYALEERTIEAFRAPIANVLLTFTNLALIIYTPLTDYNASDLATYVRSLMGSFLSWNARRKRVILPLVQQRRERYRKYLLSRVYQFSMVRHHQRLRHYAYMTRRYLKRLHHLDIIAQHNLLFLELDISNISFDEAQHDHCLMLWMYLGTVLFKAGYLSIIKLNQYKRIRLPRFYLMRLSLERLLRESFSEVNID
jgi:ribosomal protein L11